MCMCKYRLLRKEDEKFLVEKETDSLEEMYLWMKDMMEFQYRKGWV